MPFHVGIGSLGGSVFSGGALYHSANYAAYWFISVSFFYENDVFSFVWPKLIAVINQITKKDQGKLCKFT